MSVSKPSTKSADLYRILETLLKRDGRVATNTESVPVVGFLQALLDLINGDKDRALRASANCTKSTIVAVAGAIGGIGGGGPVGMGLGAAAATPLAMELRSLIAEHILDPATRNEILEVFTQTTVLEESIANGVVFGLGAHVSELFADVVAPVLTKICVGKLVTTKLRAFFRRPFSGAAAGRAHAQLLTKPQ